MQGASHTQLFIGGGVYHFSPPCKLPPTFLTLRARVEYTNGFESSR